MKIQTFLIAFLTTVLISASAQADPIEPGDFGGDGIQNQRRLALDEMFNITSPNNSSNNQNGLNRQRGRLIYSVKEANEVAKDGSVNKVRIRYR